MAARRAVHVALCWRYDDVTACQHVLTLNYSENKSGGHVPVNVTVHKPDPRVIARNANVSPACSRH